MYVFLPCVLFICIEEKLIKKDFLKVFFVFWLRQKVQVRACQRRVGLVPCCQKLASYIQRVFTNVRNLNIKVAHAAISSRGPFGP